MRDLYVYGAGGHGKVVADLVLAAGRERLFGFIDDCVPPGSLVLGHPVHGPWAWLASRAAHGPVGIVLGIGDNEVRARIARAVAGIGVEVVTVVHPRATVAPSAALGWGTVIMAGAVVNPDARIGEGVIVNTGAAVEHDVVVRNYAHISSGAALGGGSELGAYAHLGLGGVLLPGVRVGASAIIGAGAVVTRDISDHLIAVGVPARVLRSVRADMTPSARSL
jgi:sugar O-acyltransferase (sialic acid O-acetyltransferase NeuD family)